MLDVHVDLDRHARVVSVGSGTDLSMLQTAAEHLETAGNLDHAVDVVDLSDLTLLDRSTITLFVERLAASTHGRPVRLVAHRLTARTLLKRWLASDHRVTIHPTIADALADRTPAAAPRSGSEAHADARSGVTGGRPVPTRRGSSRAASARGAQAPTSTPRSPRCVECGEPSGHWWALRCEGCTLARLRSPQDGPAPRETEDRLGGEESR